MQDGERPPAIALKTRNEIDAVNKAFELHSKKALHAQSKESMGALLEEYLRVQAARRIHTPKTSHVTRLTLTALVKEWGDPKVASIDKRKVEEWRGQLQKRKGLAGPTMSEASIGSYLRRLSGFLSWLVEEKHIREHPMAAIRLGRVKKTRRDRFCTVEEREKLLADPPNEEIEFILLFGFFAGLRFGEMLAMQPDWITSKTGGKVLTVKETAYWKPKDKETRDIEIHPRIAAFLQRYGTKAPFMLEPKKPWKEPPAYRFNPKKAFRAYVVRCGLPWVTYHTLRHTFATHLAMRGARMAEIAGLLGDSLRVTEETYIAYSPASGSSIDSL